MFSLIKIFRLQNQNRAEFLFRYLEILDALGSSPKTIDLNEKTNNPGSKQPHVDLIVDVEAVRQTDGEKPSPCPKIDVTIRRVLTHKTKISSKQSQSSPTAYEEVHLRQHWAQGFKDSSCSDIKDHENDAKSTRMRSKELTLKAGKEPPLSRKANLKGE